MHRVRAIGFGVRVGVRHLSFALSEECQLVRAASRRFAEKELKPFAAQIDRDGVYPRDQIEKLSKLGFMTMSLPEKNQGKGFNTLTLALVIEELSKACAATGAIVSIHNCLYVNLIDRCGNEAQKKKYLDPATADIPGCFALSEPDAGSNVAELKTVAKRDGDYWIINGTKSWVTSAPEGKAIVVFALTDSSKKSKGMTAFIIDKEEQGITIFPKEDLMGTRALSCCTVKFDSVRVHSDNVLGEIGGGFKIAMKQLDQARIGIAAHSLGIAQAALDCAVLYSMERKAHNQPLASFPNVQGRLAEMIMHLEGSRLLTWKAALEFDTGIRCSKHSSIAKLAASDCANFVADNCIQILGAMGLVKNNSAERLYRDARGTKIYGGVTDVQKIVIAQQIVTERINGVESY